MEVTGPCPLEADLIALAECRLSETSARVEDHVDRCGHCQATLRLFRGLDPRAIQANPGTGISTNDTWATVDPVALPPRYQWRRRLGRGSQGIVVEAFDKVLNRTVALKISPLTDSRKQRRFRDEGRAIAGLDHPNILNVFDVHTEEAFGLLSMPLCERSLADRTYPWEEIISGFRELADGLAAVHDAGLVHRDVKPSNIFLKPDGIFVLGDFGLVGASQLPMMPGPSRDGEATATDHYGVLGTPAFLAPELFEGAIHTTATDQFAYFASLFRIMTGMLPAAPYRWPQGSAPKWLRAVIERGLSDRPEQRFPSMQAARDALARPRSLRYRRAGLAAVMLAGVGLWTVVPAVTPHEVLSPRCSDAPVFAWTDSDRQAVEAAAHDASESDAARAVEVNAVLGSYATATKEFLDDRCGLTAPRSLAAGTARRCLERNAGRLRAFARRLVEGETSPEALRVAAEVLPEFASFEHCGRALAVPNESPIAGRPSVAARVHAAYADAELGTADPLPTFRALVQDEDVAKFPDLLGLTKLRLFRLVPHDDSNPAALEKLVDAATQSAEIGSDPVVTAHVLCSRAGWAAHRHELDRAEHYLSFADSALVRGGNPQPEAVQCGLVRAQIAVHRGDYDRAVALARRASAGANAIGARGSECRALKIQAEALVRSQGGAETIDAASRAVERCRRTYGDEHVNTLAVVQLLAHALLEASRAQEAVSLLEAHRHVAEGTLHWGIFNQSLGRAYTETGRTDAAVESLMLAREFFEGENDAIAAGSVDIALGQAAWARGDARSACTFFERALVNFEPELEEDHSFMINTRTALAAARPLCDGGKRPNATDGGGSRG